MTAFRPTSLTLALGAALSAALCAPVHAQSLTELVESARTYDTTWQAARAQLDAAARRADQAQAGLLPSAALTSGVTRAQTDVSRPDIERTANTQTLGVNASQPLYRPANRIALEQGQRGVDVAQAQLDAATQDLLVRVSQAYFDVLAAQDTLAFVQAQKTAVSEQLASAKRNFEVGTSTVTDSREAQARYDLVIAQEIAAENDLRVKKLALDQLVGVTNAQPLPLARLHAKEGGTGGLRHVAAGGFQVGLGLGFQGQGFLDAVLHRKACKQRQIEGYAHAGHIRAAVHTRGADRACGVAGDVVARLQVQRRAVAGFGLLGFQPGNV